MAEVCIYLYLEECNPAGMSLLRCVGGPREEQRSTCNQPPPAAGAREGKIIPRHNEMLEIDGGWWRLV